LGIDKIGEMDMHHEIAHPTISCITGISPVHTDKEHMGSLNNLISQKRRIIEHLPKTGVAILNHDNEYILKMLPYTKAKVLWYGSTPDCDMYVDTNSIKVDLWGTSANFHIKNQVTFKTIKLKTQLIGTHHVYNIMCSYLICQSALPNIDILEQFTDILSKIKPLSGRMSIEKGPLNTILLNDSLRANPESTNSGLMTLKTIPYFKGRKIAVIGEMGELENPESEHKKTGNLLAQLNFDLVVCIGTLRKHTVDEGILRGLPQEKIIYAKDVFEAAEILRKNLKKGDLWYLKGSLLRNYKRIIKLLNNEKVCCNAIICPYSHCK
jgi:UDP-N-acetylmuramoyl-tripeptide--D-alanyl-D-alanine ligase